MQRQYPVLRCSKTRLRYHLTIILKEYYYGRNEERGEQTEESIFVCICCNMAGMAMAFLPVCLNNIATLGFDVIVLVTMFQ